FTKNICCPPIQNLAKSPYRFVSCCKNESGSCRNRIEFSAIGVYLGPGASINDDPGCDNVFFIVWCSIAVSREAHMKKETVLVGFSGIVATVVVIGLLFAMPQNSVAGQNGGKAAPAATPPCGPNLPHDIKNVAKDSRCFELRTYTVREGSSIDLLHS